MARLEARLGLPSACFRGVDHAERPVTEGAFHESRTTQAPCLSCRPGMVRRRRCDHVRRCPTPTRLAGAQYRAWAYLLRRPASATVRALTPECGKLHTAPNIDRHATGVAWLGGAIAAGARACRLGVRVGPPRKGRPCTPHVLARGMSRSRVAGERALHAGPRGRFAGEAVGQLGRGNAQEATGRRRCT